MAAGDAARGEALAQTWCANCHVVEPGSTAAKDTAPSLREIARRGGPDQIEARTFLNAPHPPMPNFDLARAQIDDVVAYLKSLAAR
ncbi:MAG TPA: cytochrome c [Stellaceae bacterium]|nr:cytochrome c [Stellaceae bacterium]